MIVPTTDGFIDVIHVTCCMDCPHYGDSNIAFKPEHKCLYGNGEDSQQFISSEEALTIPDWCPAMEDSVDNPDLTNSASRFVQSIYTK